MVAAPHAEAADIDFAGDTQRHRLPCRVEDIDLRIPDGPADRHGGAIVVRTARPVGDVDGRFGRPVQVVQARLRQGVQTALLQRGWQRFAAADDPAQAGAGGRQARIRILVQEGLQHGRDEMQRRDAGRRDQLRQVVRVLVPLRTREHERGAVEQRPEEFPDRDVEAERGLLQDPVVRGQPVLALHPLQPVDDAGMRVHRALRLPGRTGRIDHVGQVVGRDAQGLRVRVGAVLGGQHLRQRIQDDDRCRRVRQQGRARGLREHAPRRGIAQHRGQPFGGIARVQRHVGAARLQDAQQADDHVRAAFHADGHQLVRRHALPDQVMREAVGAGVQFA